MSVGGTPVTGGADGLSYQVVGFVGRGPTADVYRAEHPMHPGQVALKVSRYRLTPKDDAAFQRDRLLLRRLSGHPNVVELLDASTATTGRPWTVTALHDFSLAATRPGGPGWHADVAQGWCLDVLRGLAAIHAAGGTHRRLKPSNVLVKDGVAALSDLGGGTPVGHLDTAVDTPGFVAPEVVRGGPATARSDVYAAGLTLSWLLGPDAPHAVHQVVAKASSADPLARPADGTAFLEALEIAWGITPQPRPVPADDPDTVQLSLRSPADAPAGVPTQRDRLGLALGAVRRAAPLLAVLLTAGALAGALQAFGGADAAPNTALPEVRLNLPTPTGAAGVPTPSGAPQPGGGLPPTTGPQKGAEGDPPTAGGDAPATADAAKPRPAPTTAPPRLPADPQDAPQDTPVTALPIATALPPPAPPAGGAVPYAYLPELAHLPPAAEDDVRPRWDTRRTWVVVTNLGTTPVRVYWRDAFGRRVLVSTVRPQDTDTIRTRQTHTFALVDAFGRTLFVVIAPGTSGRVTIRS